MGKGLKLICLSISCMLLAPLASAQLSSNNGPIEISADRFELDDIRQEAIYNGNVDVIQGPSRLRAQKVVVRYLSEEEQEIARQTATDEQSNTGALKEIQADGEVYYITPTEKVKAETGLYEAEKEIITMSGNVRVTNVDGVIAGSHLVIDLVKGRYIMDGGGQGGRVRTVFDNTEGPIVQ
jgi:lipopolysaccharide export system protein LptA